MLCDQCFLAGSSAEGKGERRKSVYLAAERFSPHLCGRMNEYTMLGNYWNSSFYKQALICDLHVQSAKPVIPQEDLQKPLAASARGWACVLDSCMWSY